MAYRFTTMEDLAEALDAVRQAASETYGQYRSEIALYGDAWPGAYHEVQEVNSFVKELERLWAENVSQRIPDDHPVMVLRRGVWDTEGPF